MKPITSKAFKELFKKTSLPAPREDDEAGEAGPETGWLHSCLRLAVQLPAEPIVLDA